MDSEAEWTEVVPVTPWRRVLGVAAMLMLVGAACGNDQTTEAAGDSTTTTATTSTTTVPASTTSRPTPLDVEVTTDVRYHGDIEGYREPLLDVYAPTEGGPWPVVVMWHEGGGLFEDKDQWGLLAPLVAEQGAVVISPTYGITQPADILNLDIDPRYYDITATERACVLAFVTERAESYGGDPADLIAFGGSGGATVAARTVWDENEVDEGCVTQAEAAVPRTLALDEPDLLMTPAFDPVLASGALDFAEATVWDDLARSAETDVQLILGSDISVNHRIPVGDPFDGENCARDIEPGTGLILPEGAWCQWWELRDPDGAFREDAERLGLFDDGWFDVSEWSLLLADRLEAEGQEPTVTYVEGLSHGVTREEATLMAPALIDVIQG
jgi:hypothetical protein